MAKVNVENIADFVLKYLTKNEIEINHLKLQKILYYIQAWHLVYFDKEPLFEELPEAWVNGPVYRSVYNKCSSQKANKPLKYTSCNFSKDTDVEKTLTKEQLEYLQAVIDFYGAKTPEELVLLTHSERPWNEARKDVGPFDYSNNKISLESMYNYYSQKINK